VWPPPAPPLGGSISEAEGVLAKRWSFPQQVVHLLVYLFFATQKSRKSRVWHITRVWPLATSPRGGSISQCQFQRQFIPTDEKYLQMGTMKHRLRVGSSSCGGWGALRALMAGVGNSTARHVFGLSMPIYKIHGRLNSSPVLPIFGSRSVTPCVFTQHPLFKPRQFTLYLPLKGYWRRLRVGSFTDRGVQLPPLHTLGFTERISGVFVGPEELHRDVQSERSRVPKECGWPHVHPPTLFMGCDLR
jgi:hypothetical protein